ncbi:hypothetical protein [Actinomadura sp. 9N407]|uniref:hypothetical protein n=1 Tax=Actinomadura sp. 9N407 TaxID=3375154 RepID=UPI003792A5A3
MNEPRTDPETEPETEAVAETEAEDVAEDLDVAEAPEAVFQVRVRMTWRGVGQVLAFLILVLAAAGFVAGGLSRGSGTAAMVFIVLGALGFALFGAGLLATAGRVLGRRPVLELTPEGVLRPARWPMPRRADRTLPWSRIEAMTALRRGVPSTRRGEQDYLVFLPSAELVEMARTADRPRLIALTLTDVPATAEAAAWCFAVEPAWDASLKEIVAQARRRALIPVIDRRKR